MNIKEAISKIKPLEKKAILEAEKLQKNFVKPEGSLGELERISIQFAGITGKVKNVIKRKKIFLFGSDHGIYEEGVSSSPQKFTAELMKVYADKKNAGINILSSQAGAELEIFDLGVKNFNNHENITTKKFMKEGTKNFLKERSMSVDTAKNVIEFGISLVEKAKKDKIDIIGTGEVGMGNTTPAAACIMAVLKSRDESFVGRGAGLNEQAFSRKKRVIIQGLNFHEKYLNDSVNIISCVGGLDIAAMTGVFLGGAVFRIPVVIDGVISIAGALLAVKISEGVRDFIFASNKSPEPAYSYAAKELELEPFLNLKMRLGEGTACAIGMQIIEDSLAIINNMGNINEL